MDSCFIDSTPRFPWQDPTVIDVPEPLGAACPYVLIGPDDSDIFIYLTGTITAIKTSPFAFKGTAVDSVVAALAPQPSGLQDVEITCSFPARQA